MRFEVGFERSVYKTHAEYPSSNSSRLNCAEPLPSRRGRRVDRVHGNGISAGAISGGHGSRLAIVPEIDLATIDSLRRTLSCPAGVILVQGFNVELSEPTAHQRDISRRSAAELAGDIGQIKNLRQRIESLVNYAGNPGVGRTGPKSSECARQFGDGDNSRNGDFAKS
jgi:hypothetical protein